MLGGWLKAIRLLGYTLFVAGLVLFFSGIATYSFDSTEGQLHFYAIEPSEIVQRGKNQISQVPAERIEYSYVVEGEDYTSRRIAMGFRNWTISPLSKMEWEIDIAAHKPLTVFYLTSLPSYSILHKGFDVVSTFVLLLVGYGLLKIETGARRLYDAA